MKYDAWLEATRRRFSLLSGGRDIEKIPGFLVTNCFAVGLTPDLAAEAAVQFLLDRH